jgi:hypothetical protein
MALLGELDGESKIALEATYGWEWLAELLEDHGYELYLAPPLRTKAVKPTPSTPARLPSCCAPICCPRLMWRRGSCATYAARCASGWR